MPHNVEPPVQTTRGDSPSWSVTVCHLYLCRWLGLTALLPKPHDTPLCPRVHIPLQQPLVAVDSVHVVRRQARHGRDVGEEGLAQVGVLQLSLRVVPPCGRVGVGNCHRQLVGEGVAESVSAKVTIWSGPVGGQLRERGREGHAHTG